MSYYRKSEDTHPSILQRFRCKIICEHLLCKQAEIQSKSLFWLRFRISDEAKYVPKMFLLRWAAQIDQRCVPRCNPQPKAGMAYSLRRCFWAFATLRL